MSLSRRRARALNAADRALWQAYVARVDPLPGRALPPPESGEATPVVTAPQVSLAVQSTAPQAWQPPPIQVNVTPAGLDDKRWRALRRGKTKPERTLDLHGRRAQEAHDAVRGFLLDAFADGLRCVAVITGRGSSPEGGVLRRELPHWLNAPDLRRLLLAAAQPPAANTGAVHLLLRRRK
ncbi:MAG: Smr/MutS family protein [Alphaproteobacteria bacterium]